MIKRYTQPVVQTTPEPGFHIEEVPLFEDAKGKFVLHSDYAALETRCATLTAEVMHYTAGTPHPLEARCRELEAEKTRGYAITENAYIARIAALEAALRRADDIEHSISAEDWYKQRDALLGSSKETK